MGALSGELALFARVVGQHERDHVKAFKGVLGRKAVKKPRFNFRGTTEDAAKFAATAQALEDTGVAAYKGQAPKINRTRSSQPRSRFTRSRRATRAGSATSTAPHRRRPRSTSR